MPVERRTVIVGGLAAAAEFAIACSGGEIFFPTDQSPKSEKRTKPQEGDIVKYNGKYYLIRFNTYYQIPDIEKYKKATKFNKYGRQEFSLVWTGGNIVPGQLPQFPADFDEFTGHIYFKDLKRGGGEVIDFYAGFGTNEEEETAAYTEYDLTNDPNRGTFFMPRREFRKRGWIFADYHHFVYGAEKKPRDPKDPRPVLYDWRDTAQPVEENIKNALYFAETNQKASPLSQRNGIAHSLGAVFLLEVAMAHPDWFNNLILVNPVLWLKDEPPEEIKRFLRVWPDLVNCCKSEAYRKKIRDFVSSFKKSGKKIYVVKSENDPLLSLIEGVQEVILQFSGRISNPLEAHGRPLKDERVAKFIAEAIGQKVSS